MRDERVAGILLAAGAARRFGSDKLTADWGGMTLLQHSAAAMLEAGLEPVLAVVGPGVTPAVPEAVRTVVNHRWHDGIATSIQAGLAALDGEPAVGAAVIAPADQPWCGAQVYRRLLHAYRGSDQGVVVAAYGGAMRNPVLLARSRWPLAEQIKGDIGLSAVVRAQGPLTVECGDAGSVTDIDTPEDLARARRSVDALLVDTADPPATRRVTWEELDDLVVRLAHATGRDYDLLLAISRGGLVPAGMLAYRLDLREIVVAGAVFYLPDGATRDAPLLGQFPEPALLAGRRILVVDEVWETGETMAAVLARVRDAGGQPTSAVLHYKPGRSRVSEAPDHFAASEDGWLAYPYKADDR